MPPTDDTVYHLIYVPVIMVLVNDITQFPQNFENVEVFSQIHWF